MNHFQKTTVTIPFDVAFAEGTVNKRALLQHRQTVIELAAKASGVAGAH
jgi:hypothetical protein